MREISYRGRRVDNGEWAAGHYLTKRTKDHGLQHMISVQDMWGFHEVDSETVGQYTGLKDRNDKEIFEGDILLCESNGIQHYEHRVVCYDIFQTRYKAVPPTAYHQNAGQGGWTGYELKYHNEVIGNIHEHPHLLKGKEA